MNEKDLEQDYARFKDEQDLILLNIVYLQEVLKLESCQSFNPA